MGECSLYSSGYAGVVVVLVLVLATLALTATVTRSEFQSTSDPRGQGLEMMDGVSSKQGARRLTRKERREAKNPRNKRASQVL